VKPAGPEREVIERFLAGEEVPGIGMNVGLREHDVERVLRAELRRLRAIEAKARLALSTYRTREDVEDHFEDLYEEVCETINYQTGKTSMGEFMAGVLQAILAAGGPLPPKPDGEAT
jgi:hypothetical protein